MRLSVPQLIAVAESTVDRSYTVPERPSTGTLAGRFVKSWFESLSPGYLTGRQKQEGGAQVEPVSFCPDPIILAERLVGYVCPEYRLLTTAFPETSISSRLPAWLPRAAGRAVTAGWNAVPPLNPVRLMGKLLTVGRDAFCLSLLTWLPQASAATIKVNSASVLNRIGRGLPRDGNYEQTADINAESRPSVFRFSGTYDGKYHTIYNVKIYPFSINDGIIGNVTFRYADSKGVDAGISLTLPYEGRLQNIEVEDAVIIGEQYASIVTQGHLFYGGEMTNITVRRCHAVATGVNATAVIAQTLGKFNIHDIRFVDCTASAKGENAKSAILASSFEHGYKYGNVTIEGCSVAAYGAGSAAGMLIASTEHGHSSTITDSGSEPFVLNETLELGDNVIINGGSVSVSGDGSSAALIAGRIQKDLSVSLRHLRAYCVNIFATGINSTAGLIYGAVFEDHRPGHNSKATTPSVITNDTVACNIRVNGVVNDAYCPDPNTNTSCPVFEMPAYPDFPTPQARAPTTRAPATVKYFKKIDTFPGSYIVNISVSSVCLLLVISFVLIRLCGNYRKGLRGRELFCPLLRRRRPAAATGEQNSQGGVRYNVLNQTVIVDPTPTPPYSPPLPLPLPLPPYCGLSTSVTYMSRDGVPTVENRNELPPSYSSLNITEKGEETGDSA